MRPNVALWTCSTAIDDYPQNDESNAACYFDQGEEEFDFAVTADTEDLDDSEEGQEDGYPDSDVDVCSPKLNRDTSCSEFEGKDGEPSDGVIPAYCETTVNSSESGVATEALVVIH